MIEFYFENNFTLPNKDKFVNWLQGVIEEEGYTLGELTFVFCDDEYLWNINMEFLKHDTLTDIITFDYNLGKEVFGEIYISTERVEENAGVFEVTFMEELARVLVHGVLHLCGYKDKETTDKDLMRTKENHYLARCNFVSS